MSQYYIGGSGKRKGGVEIVGLDLLRTADTLKQSHILGRYEHPVKAEPQPRPPRHQAEAEPQPRPPKHTKQRQSHNLGRRSAKAEAEPHLRPRTRTTTAEPQKQAAEGHGSRATQLGR